MYVVFDDNGKIKSYKKKEEINDKKDIYNKMFDFRNIIMEDDYFGQIFEKFKQTIINEVNFESFNSISKYSKLTNITYNFNKIKIKDKIEKAIV